MTKPVEFSRGQSLCRRQQPLCQTTRKHKVHWESKYPSRRHVNGNILGDLGRLLQVHEFDRIVHDCLPTDSRYSSFSGSYILKGGKLFVTLTGQALRMHFPLRETWPDASLVIE